MENKKLDVRDLVNAGLFSVLIIMVGFISGMIGFIPVTMPFISFVGGIATGPIFMIYSTKIRKPGMITIQIILSSLVYIATGHGLWIISTAVLACFLGEYFLKKGNYRSVKYARLAYTAAAINYLGNYLPIFIAREVYLQNMLESGYSKDFADKMMSVLPNWSLIPITILGIVGTYIGCTIGIKILKKHFEKSGMIKEV